MFYVYSGYIGPDNYDQSSGPTYKLLKFKTAEEVIKFKKEFDEQLDEYCGHVLFTVIEGEERKVEPIKVVTEWTLV